MAKIPDELAELSPVPQTSTFQPMSTTVDVTTEKQTLRMGVAVDGTPAEPTESQPTTASRASDRPDLALFAVGDSVWMDLNRSGTQDPGETPASRISVQLLNVDGDVVASTVSAPSGHYVFDHLTAGTYSVRFAGVPKDFRLTPTGLGDQRANDWIPTSLASLHLSPSAWVNPTCDRPHRQTTCRRRTSIPRSMRVLLRSATAWVIGSGLISTATVFSNPMSRLDQQRSRCSPLRATW